MSFGRIVLFRERTNDMKKKSNNKGETITETLVSLLLISLAMLMLPGAIVASAKLNKAVENEIVYPQEGTKNSNVAGLKIKLTCEGQSSTYTGISVNRYGDEGDGLYEFVK